MPSVGGEAVYTSYTSAAMDADAIAYVKELADIKAAGILTEEEFAEQKAAILGASGKIASNQVAPAPSVPVPQPAAQVQPIMPVMQGGMMMQPGMLMQPSMQGGIAGAGAVVPAPMAMARTDLDIELLSSEIMPNMVGTWKTKAPVSVGPCCGATSEANYRPLDSSLGGYPFDVTIKVKCCGCCPFKNETATGMVSSDGTSTSWTDANGFKSGGTLADLDSRTKKVTYQLWGSSSEGPMSGKTVAEPHTYTSTLHVGGRTMVFPYWKQ